MTETITNNTILRWTSAGLLARNTVFNLTGQAAPLLIAIFAIPILIKGLGTERFGVLTLVWMVIGYVSLFDLGVGRALTKLVAEKLGAGQEEVIPSLVWTSLLLLLILGAVGALMITLLSPWLVHHILRVPDLLKPEALHAFYLLALLIPVTIDTAALRGILEAQQRFGLVNAARIGMGVFTFLGPIAILPFSQSLIPVVSVLAAGRLFALLIHLLLCLKIMPELRYNVLIQRGVVVPLLRFGGWITVSNIISSIMFYFDRFLIGGLVSIAAVAYYVTPYEVVTRLWLIPVAVAGVLFPAFATSSVQDPKRTSLLFHRGVKYVFLLLFPITLIIVTFAEEGLNLWLGEEFAQYSTRVLQWLAIGVFINSLARIPFVLLQGTGRPDLTAKLHFIECPFYLLLTWLMIRTYGIEGAAIAWIVRVSVDATILFWMARSLLPKSVPAIGSTALIVGSALLTLAFPILPIGISTQGFFLLLMLPTFGFAAWFLILAPEERNLVQKYLKIDRVFK